MDNFRGIALMVLSMACFAIEDGFVSTLAAEVPLGQIIVVLGGGGCLAFAFASFAKGEKVSRETFRHPAIWIRNLGELVGTICFVISIKLVGVATTSVVLQAAPLIVTMGAALFLGAVVGWRRWLAILCGFTGVMVVMQPGTETFRPEIIVSVVAVICLSIRDLATRVIPPTVTSLQLSALGFGSIVPGGMVLMALFEAPIMPSMLQSFWFICALCFGVVGYWAITAAMRVGDIPVVTPFRYSRLVFAMIIGVIILGEEPETSTYIGMAIILASGLYTLIREQRLARKARAFQHELGTI